MSEQDQTRVEPVFDTNTAAPLLGITPGTLQVWRCQGKGPRYIKSGSKVIYRLRDINAYLDSRTRKSTADPGA